ncbi:MAG: hypothetical protein N4J56_007733 [Chroococcidiopsis sp. SAG 2025]|nr:hypothetical protein [Chroococcidiopsis sp. SAG 2025]
MNRPQALQQAQQTLRVMTGSILDQTYRPKLEAMLNLNYDEAENKCRQATTKQERKYWAGVTIRIGDTLDMIEYLCAQPYPLSTQFTGQDLFVMGYGRKIQH